MYTAEICRDVNAFFNLREHWDFLLEQTTNKTPFLTWEWLFSWWKYFGQSKDLFIVLVRDSSHDLVGIAPLFIHKTKFYHFPVKEMTLIGVGHSDRQDFLIKESDTQILNTIIKQIFLNKNEWDIVYLDQIPHKSILFEQAFHNSYYTVVESSSVCPFVKIQGTWEEFYNSLSYKFRRDLKNRTNKLNKSGHWELIIKTTSNDLKKDLEEAVAIEGKSRKVESKKSFLLKSDNFNFILEFLNFCKERDWMDLSELTLNSVLIAYLIGFRYNNNYYAYNMAFDENFMEISPGKILFLEKIKWCFQHFPMIKEFDLLRGDSYSKSKWTDNDRQHYRIVFFNNKFHLIVLRFLIIKIKPILKKIIRIFNKSDHLN